MTQSSLEKNNPELFSNLRRLTNSLKEKQALTRKQSILQLLRIIQRQSLSVDEFYEISQMCLKEILKCFSDHLEVCRQTAVKIIIQLISRNNNISTLLPYIFSILIDRTNCYDLEGITNVPQKMRPPPGQKPKVMLKINQTCEQIRMLYCNLIQRIISLIDQNQVRKNLDDLINIMRALIMDPSPQIQKTACNVLENFCKQYKLLLLHYTQILGRSVLLPLISKKSKIRIAGLNALTSILWCGLWKYNAFVFENLIGFRDPNSVPIKDFYEPSHNINYLATFIIDNNVKVRQQFLKNLYIWTCQIDDKYDHHGRIVPYILSGLFDQDQQVRNFALKTIQQIGRQIEIQRQKDFRENKQFAIDAAWTWNGKLTNLPLYQPLKTRPTLGSRFFVRGHVRKMWNALYKQVKQINLQNRLRAVNLILFGVIYTQNYITQYLDNFIPQLLPCLVSQQPQDKQFIQKLQLIFYFIGRYCEQSGYLHIIKSIISGDIVQNQFFIKASFRCLYWMLKGNLQAIPIQETLSHKTKDIINLLDMLNNIDAAKQIYKFNCRQSCKIAELLIEKIKQKGSKQQIIQIMDGNYLSVLKFLGASYYQSYYSTYFALKQIQQNEMKKDSLTQFIKYMDILYQMYPTCLETIQQYLEEIYINPPAVLDLDWKIIIILHNYLVFSQKQDEIFPLVQDTIAECIKSNNNVEMINFTTNYLEFVISCHNILENKQRIIQTNKILKTVIICLKSFQTIKKVPIYDSHLQKKQPGVHTMNQDNFIHLFETISSSLRRYYLEKIQLKQDQLAAIFIEYFSIFDKIKKDKPSAMTSVKTLWVIFERSQKINQSFPQKFIVNKQPTLPKIIDFLIERLETIGENTDPKKINMIFSILNKICKCWPKMSKITDKLTYVYPEFPQLFDKLAKYTLNEKDIETKDKYFNFLTTISQKAGIWLQYEADMSHKAKRFQKAKLLTDVLKKANII